MFKGEDGKIDISKIFGFVGNTFNQQKKSNQVAKNSNQPVTRGEVEAIIKGYMASNQMPPAPAMNPEDKNAGVVSGKVGAKIQKHDVGGMLGNIGSVANGMKSGVNQVGGFAGALGGFANGIGDPGTFGNNFNSMLGPSPQEIGKEGKLTSGLNSAYDGIQSAAANIPVYGKLISGVMGANKVLGKAVSKIGGGTDGMTKADAIMGSAFMQMTPLGLINGFGGSKSHTLNDTFEQTNMLYGDQTMSGFAGTQDGVGKTMQYSNKKYGLFSSHARKKANSAIDKLNYQQNQIQDIAASAQNAFDIQTSMSSTNENATALALNGGYQQGAIHVGKDGMKIDYSYVFTKPKFEYDFSDNVIQEFKKGGQMSVIPTGNLHARLHHMSDADGLTKKGIPVVDNDGNQQAEIELNEIIFNKETTSKLEKLFKQYEESQKDDLCIEAGKVLTCEIMTNTDDKTGLINTI